MVKSIRIVDDKNRNTARGITSLGFLWKTVKVRDFLLLLTPELPRLLQTGTSSTSSKNADLKESAWSKDKLCR
jgi:hypothetical protein